MGHKGIVKWSGSVKDDDGEQNFGNQQLHESRMHPNRSKRVPTLLKTMLEREYGYSLVNDGNPWIATVLHIFNGPNSENGVSTKGVQTTVVNADTWFVNKTVSKPKERRERIRLLARIPEFDTGLNWPMDKEDFIRICAHGEYHERGQGPSSGLADCHAIQVGDLVLVTLRGKNTSPADGRQAGFIIGLHSKALLEEAFQEGPHPSIQFAKPCKSNRDVSGPPPEYLRGETEKKPAIAYPIIEKYKTRIKTGLYGNGTPQTKYHFNRALSGIQGAKRSFKYDVPGPAPGKDDAFIWVGHLRNNGYLDLVDRPISLGRETIIYAPMTLDVTVPIELKYYFHDRAGFGHAWVNGPDTKVGESIDLVETKGNDFREKIAPAIKDMIKDRRNFILVIPEMSYSRGFGTKSNNVTRTKKMSVGKKAGFSAGTAHKESHAVIRTKITKPEVFSTVKEYLRGLPAGRILIDEGIFTDDEILTSNVLQKTHLRERETVTFDGSFTGGLFGNFHVEVLDIIKNYLGKHAYDNINYISILADGMGAINLASIVKFMTYSTIHNNAENSFKSVPINRIDYVESSKDMSEIYNFSNMPAYSMYEDYLIARAEGSEYFEFNYITEKNSTHGRSFFNKLGHIDLYDSSIKSANSSGDKKFSLKVAAALPLQKIEIASNIRAVINMHVLPKGPSLVTSDTTKKTAYAFVMRDDSDLTPDTLVTSDSNSSQTPVNDFVPDHAGAMASRPSEGMANKYEKDLRDLKDKINTFANNVLNSLQAESFCTDPKTTGYCTGAGGVNYEGPIAAHFQGYLTNLENYFYYFVLLQHELNIVKIKKVKKELQNYLNKDPFNISEEYDDAVANNKNKNWFDDFEDNFGDMFRSLVEDTDKYDMKKAAKKLAKGPTKLVMPSDEPRRKFFVTDGDIDDDAARAAYAHIMYNVARERALRKIKEDLAGFIEASEPVPSTAPNPDCDPPPVTLEEIRTMIPRRSAKYSRFSEQTCAGNNIKVVSTFKELKTILSWNPEIKPLKEAMGSDKKYTNLWTNIDKEAVGYKTKRFTYKARAKINPVYRESPLVWSCISEKIRESWEAACNISNYIPFRITSGIKGIPGVPDGVTAYNNGMSIDSFGLSINVDPPLAGYSADGKPVYSVFTGMWTPGFVETVAQELYDLGVLYTSPNTMSESPLAIITSAGIGSRYLDNAYETGFYYDQNMSSITLAEGHGELEVPEFEAPAGVGEALEDLGMPHKAKKPVETDGGFIMPEPRLVAPDPRLIENWSGAPDSYDGPSGTGEKKAGYDKDIKEAKGQLIVPPGANPVVWLLTFCERSGMKWGNSFFLKKRFRGGKQTWTPAEQRRIAAIYGIPDIVARIYAISWPATSVDKHMHFQYYAGGPIITWEEIEEK